MVVSSACFVEVVRASANLDMLGTVECGGWTYACMLANSVGHIWVNGLESEAEHTHARA